MGSFAPKGHAKLDPQRPSAFAICERCGFLYNHRDLTFQMAWFGNAIRSTRWLVCPKCDDVPNPQMQAYKLPPDPVPIANPRAETPHKHVRRWPGEPFPQPYEGLPDIPEE
jgi:hypothetical protein